MQIIFDPPGYGSLVIVLCVFSSTDDGVKKHEGSVFLRNPPPPPRRLVGRKIIRLKRKKCTKRGGKRKEKIEREKEKLKAKC